MHVTSSSSGRYAAWLESGPRLAGARSRLIALGACAALILASPTVVAQVDDVSVYRRQPAGASDAPSVDTTRGTADGPSRDTTDGASDVPESPSDSDATGQKSPKRRKSEKTGRSGDDGGSSNATGAAAAAAAIITGVAITVSQQRKKQLATCEENLRSLRGRSIGDAVSVLDPAEYEVTQRRRVPAPADGDVAAGAVFDSKARKIRDGKCVVTLVYAESPPSPVPPDVPIPEFAQVPQSVSEPQTIPQAPVTPKIVAAPTPPPPPPPPPRCRTPIEVASFVGGTRAAALSWIGPQDLRLIETWVPSSRPEGEVLQQQPDAPAQLRCGSALEVTVSDGSLVVVPAVTTLTVERARDLIESTTLMADATDADSDRSPGEVLEQSPAAGSEVPRGSTVRIAVASGLFVPDVTGLGLAAALQPLQAFQVVPTMIESDLDKDIVASQSPVGGSRAAAGSRVTLDVSAGPWPPPWHLWLVIATLLALAAVALRYLLPRLVHASARLDADGSVRTGSPVVAEGPSLRVDARLDRGSSRVLFPGEAA